MSIHRVSSGSGYEYYTREVAAADERLERDQKLGDYYLESGAPPGQWTGSGCAHFKLTGEVTNAQMRDLFGEGKRPDAQQIRDAKGGIVDEDTLFLGQKMGAHSQANTRFRERINEHIEHFIAREGRPPTGAEKQQIRFMIGRGEFTREKMRAPLNNEELSRYIAARLRPNGGSVAGFDCTFSAPKSVSIMWALGDADVRTAVEEAHLEAINTALSFMEADVFSSRAGKNGVRRVSIDGVMAARFRHYDSRAGDPQLHDHLVIANRVFCPNDTGSGTWRTLDSRALYKAVVASSEHYNDALMVALHKRLGVRFEARGGQGNSATKMEIEGVDDELIDTFSTRRISIQRRLDELVAAYHNDHGRAPSKKPACSSPNKPPWKHAAKNNTCPCPNACAPGAPKPPPATRSKTSPPPRPSPHNQPPSTSPPSPKPHWQASNNDAPHGPRATSKPKPPGKSPWPPPVLLEHLKPSPP